MLKCKDCLHYEVCRNWYILTGHSAKEADEISELEYEYEDNFCTYSKDKSLIAELPCRVGDTVYSYCETFSRFFAYQVENVFISRENIQYEAFANEGSELIDVIDFNCDDFGKTVFLTHDEAESVKGV